MLSSQIRVTHWRVLLVLHPVVSIPRPSVRLVDSTELTYLSPFRFLYRFPQTSHLKGFSFSMPSVPGYGVLVSGLTMEKVPSPFSCNCWVECPWVLWYLGTAVSEKGGGLGILQKVTYFRPFWFL